MAGRSGPRSHPCTEPQERPSNDTPHARTRPLPPLPDPSSGQREPALGIPPSTRRTQKSARVVWTTPPSAEPTGTAPRAAGRHQSQRPRPAVRSWRAHLEDPGARAQGEADRLVQANRRLVGGRGMQERCLPAFPDARRDRAYQSRREALPAVGRVGADRADLCPAGQPQPFTGHRDQPPLLPDAQVGAELHAPREERPRSGAGDQLKDLRYVTGPKPHRLRRVLGPKGHIDQLHSARPHPSGKGPTRK